MDGDIPPPKGRATQQEYWSPMCFTAFINVVNWLVTKAWVSRSSELSPGDAVTVEPAEVSKPNATLPAEGSYWAEVIAARSSGEASASGSGDPERREYGVRCMAWRLGRGTAGVG